MTATKKRFKVKAIPNFPGFKVTVSGYEENLITRSSFSEVRLAVRDFLNYKGVERPYKIELTVCFEED